jgi:hypothetical protein
MKLLADGIAFTFDKEEAPANFQPLTKFPLLILVGLTGVGKSTVLKLLQESDLNLTLLPNRRYITDEIIIASLQQEAGHPLQPVTDRVKRFEYTARYRTKFPGGMAHALSRLTVNPAQSNGFFIFEGLRGLAEVEYAVTYFPQARFIVLDAPNMIRLNRLLKRGEAFDTTALPSSLVDQNLIMALRNVPSIKTVFSEEQLHQIARRAQANQIPMDTAVKKATIIVGEQRNYDPNAAREFLGQTLPPERVLVVNTANRSPHAVAQQVENWVRGSKQIHSPN